MSSSEASTDRFEELPPSPTSSTRSFASANDDLPSTSTPLNASPPAPPTNEDREDEGEEEPNEDSIWWTPSELRDILARSTALKESGNKLFDLGKWDLAMQDYKEGLVELPVRTKANLVRDEKGKGKEEEEDPEDKTEGEGKREEKEARELRAILSANVAACQLKMERWKEAAASCDDALEDSPQYVKALSRRATANEKVGSWSSLSAALTDYKTLISLPDVPPPILKAAREGEKRLPRLIKLQQEKEKEEVMGKLKDLGNTVLGKFGLSTDNFQFVPQAGGGYSMNFTR